MRLEDLHRGRFEDRWGLVFFRPREQPGHKPFVRSCCGSETNVGQRMLFRASPTVAQAASTVLLSRSASLTGRLFHALRGADCVVLEPVPVFAIGPRFNALTNEIIATIVTATTRMPTAHPNKPGSVDV